MSRKATPLDQVTIWDDYFSYTGTSGADQIDVFGNHDTVNGAGGNDYINLGGSYSNISGGTGNDTVGAYFEHDNYINGGAGNDSIRSTGNYSDTVLGGIGDDSISASSGHENLLNGGAGDDYITSNGEYGDTLIGGAGNDLFWLISPMIFLAPADDRDFTLTGGSGADTFKFSGSGGSSNVQYSYNTVVTDFNVAEDTLQFYTNLSVHVTKEELDVSFSNGNTVIAFADPVTVPWYSVIENITLVGVDENEWAQVNVG